MCCVLLWCVVAPGGRHEFIHRLRGPMRKYRTRLQRHLHLLRQQLVMLYNDLLIFKHIQHQHRCRLCGNRAGRSYRPSPNLFTEHHAFVKDTRALVVDTFLTEKTVGQVDFYVSQ